MEQSQNQHLSTLLEIGQRIVEQALAARPPAASPPPRPRTARGEEERASEYSEGFDSYHEFDAERASSVASYRNREGEAERASSVAPSTTYADDYETYDEEEQGEVEEERGSRAPQSPAFHPSPVRSVPSAEGGIPRAFAQGDASMASSTMTPKSEGSLGGYTDRMLEDYRRKLQGRRHKIEATIAAKREQADRVLREKTAALMASIEQGDMSLDFEVEIRAIVEDHASVAAHLERERCMLAFNLKREQRKFERLRHEMREHEKHLLAAGRGSQSPFGGPEDYMSLCERLSARTESGGSASASPASGRSGPSGGVPARHRERDRESDRYTEDYEEEAYTDDFTQAFDSEASPLSGPRSAISALSPASVVRTVVTSDGDAEDEREDDDVEEEEGRRSALSQSTRDHRSPPSYVMPVRRELGETRSIASRSQAPSAGEVWEEPSSISSASEVGDGEGTAGEMERSAIASEVSAAQESGMYSENFDTVDASYAAAEAGGGMGPRPLLEGEEEDEEGKASVSSSSTPVQVSNIKALDELYKARRAKIDQIKREAKRLLRKKKEALEEAERKIELAADEGQARVLAEAALELDVEDYDVEGQLAELRRATGTEGEDQGLDDILFGIRSAIEDEENKRRMPAAPAHKPQPAREQDRGALQREEDSFRDEASSRDLADDELESFGQDMEVRESREGMPSDLVLHTESVGSSLLRGPSMKRLTRAML
jgi:hypothetical protein